jgi:hypothetical protein
MLFCLGEGKDKSEGDGYQKNNRIFNVEVTHAEWQKAIESLPKIQLGITIDKKKITYEEAWREVWDKLSQTDRQKYLDLPHFDKDIFKSITGIGIDTKIKEMTVSEISTQLGYEVKVIKEG